MKSIEQLKKEHEDMWEELRRKQEEIQERESQQERENAHILLATAVMNIPLEERGDKLDRWLAEHMCLTCGVEVVGVMIHEATIFRNYLNEDTIVEGGEWKSPACENDENHNLLMPRTVFSLEDFADLLPTE